MNERLTETIKVITNHGKPDGYKNYIVHESEQNLLHVVNETGDMSIIGSVTIVGSELTLTLDTMERTLHHKTKSWGVNLHTFNQVQKLVIRTEVAEYVIRKKEAAQAAMLFNYSRDSLAVDVHIPKYMWARTYIDYKFGPMIDMMGIEWFQILKGELAKPYVAELSAFVNHDRARHEVFPNAEHVFKAFKLTPPSQTKVVIIGDEPYTGKHSDGLAFSSNDEEIVPDALINIFNEIESDVYNGFFLNFLPDLARLSVQGVLLLNSVLTTNSYGFGAHAGKGWELLTTEALSGLTKIRQGIVYILLGENAQLYKQLINPKTNCILEASHPADAFKHGHKFLGSQVFTKANEYLKQQYPRDSAILW